MATKFLQYRIPPMPFGHPYYRQGTRYEPGELVRLPENEIPPGWSRDEAGKIVNSTKHPKTGKITGRKAPHAWKLITPGQKEATEEELSELDAAKQALEEAKAQLAERERLLEEAESAATAPKGRAPRRGPVEEEEAEETEEETDGGEEPAGEEEPSAEGAEDQGEKPKGRKGRKRASEKDL